MTLAFQNPWRNLAYLGALLASVLVPWKLLRNPSFAQERRITVSQSEAPLDALIMGSSRIWAGLDTGAFKRELSARAKRDAAVVTLGWSMAGYDRILFALQDITKIRQVKNLIIYDEPCRENRLHWASSVWWRRVISDDQAMTNMSLQGRAGIFGSAILAAPRFIWCELRNREQPPDAGPIRTLAELTSSLRSPTLGSLMVRNTLGGGHDFVPLAPQKPPAGKAQLKQIEVASDTPRLPVQRYYLTRLAKFCEAQSIRLIVVDLPIYHDRTDSTAAVSISSGEHWQPTLAPAATLIGVPLSAMFADLSEVQLRQFFYDERHLNANGQALHTALIAPQLAELCLPDAQ